MTIRRRLFWTNILMLVIPSLLSAVMAYVILFVFTQYSPDSMERAFPQAFQALLRFQKGGDLEDLYESVDNFNLALEGDRIYMAVLTEEGYAYPPAIQNRLIEQNELLDTVIRSGATGAFRYGDIKYSIETIGEYRLLFIDGREQLSRAEVRRPMLLHLPVLFAILLVIVLSTNRFLTWLVTKKITVPLALLAEGARELGEGNLDHRIVYRGKDEFAPVCADFNVMAGQLQKLIEYQRRTEESRKELLAGISHDLRTPLTSIKAYVEGLLDGVAEDLPSQLRYLTIIRNKAQDIDQLVDKLFLFSKLDIGEYPVNLEQIDLGDELSHMVGAALEDYRGKGLRFELETPPEGVLIETDPVCLHNVFTNIVENSLRYKTREECTVRVECSAEPDRALVRITDDGPGVREEELERLFDVFYRSDPSRQNPNKGSGIGLAISARMMARIGGKIRAENAEEGGLRMVLELPRRPRTQEGEGEG